jgi:hypothetical protein
VIGWRSIHIKGVYVARRPSLGPRGCHNSEAVTASSLAIFWNFCLTPLRVSCQFQPSIGPFVSSRFACGGGGRWRQDHPVSKKELARGRASQDLSSFKAIKPVAIAKQNSFAVRSGQSRGWPEKNPTWPRDLWLSEKRKAERPAPVNQILLR